MIKYYTWKILILLQPLLVLLVFHSACQAQLFHKISSGTQSDIRSLKKDRNGNLYFLTDNIYSLRNDTWKKLEFPPEGRIYTYFPVSEQDIWFTVNQVTNTSILYHYHDGMTETIGSPFSNHITSIFFTSATTGIFASFSEIAILEKGGFRKLPPCPSHNSIEKIYAKDISSIWTLTNFGELFLYENGIYSCILGWKKVTDFCFHASHDGYVLCSEELYHVDGSAIKMVYTNPDLKRVRKIALMDDGSLIMAGEYGSIMTYRNGILSKLPIPCSENLTGILITEVHSTWISGENGRLLYNGPLHFPEYDEENQGFSSHKMTSFGILTDDEYGVAMADFDGDGKTDIYVVRIFEQNHLYINHLPPSNKMPAGGFTDETVKRNATGVISPELSNATGELKLGICVADIDNDGDQDIYLCYLNSTNRLLLNKGNGYFRNVSEQENRACLNMKRSNTAAFADIDNDGDLDLFVANEEGSNRFFENDGSGHFRDITETSGLASSSGGMCASFADVNGDGLPDLCVSFWNSTNKLYLNESAGGKIHFRDVSCKSGLDCNTPSKSNAVVFADVNNDGFPDLFIASRNGDNKLYLNDGTGIFTDRSKEFLPPGNKMSNGAVFADFDLDGYQDLYITNVGENVLYKNMRGQYFTDVTVASNASLEGYCTGCATGDVDQDGDPDLYVANYINGDSKLFLNVSERRSFIKFRLHGFRSNRDAIGAKVWLYRAASKQKGSSLQGYRELSAGSGYGSVNEKEMIFGVEPGVNYFALVKFPSTPDTLKVDQLVAGKTLDINEFTGFRAVTTRFSKGVTRFITDEENRPEIIKYSLVLLLLLLYTILQRKSANKIVITRWLSVTAIFMVFIFVNGFYLYSWPSMLFFISPLIASGLLVILHLFIGRILMRRIASKEKLELREKLSRDLHDDLASTLGSASIYAQSLKGLAEPSPDELKKLSLKIAGLTQSALQSVSDIIWMTSPRNDTLQSLVSKISVYLREQFTHNGISYSETVGLPEKPAMLEESLRNNIFLMIKEAAYNIVKHSRAENAEFRVEMTDKDIIIYLADDGIGIASTDRQRKGLQGHGLVNMQKRARESGIEFTIQSIENEGTKIIMKFKI